MPSSLIIVALVVAWLLVLVPIVARRRQEVARTADSTLAARVVRSGGVRSTAEREPTMADTSEVDTERDEEYDADFDPEYDPEYDRAEDFDPEYDEDPEFVDDYDDYRGEPRPFRPGRGGYDAEAAAITARARYTFRQRIVVLMLLAAIITALVAATMAPLVWWAFAAVDIGLVGYLGYLRRQVRIEEEIRDRRAARLETQRRAYPPPVARPEYDAHGPAEDDAMVEESVVEPEPERALPQRPPLTRHVHPGTVIVDMDDEDPMFAELDDPGALPYRRAVGE